jgi:Cdc6-like AAA superfamily ATPase
MKEEILANAEVLSHSYMPEKLLHRENELAQLKHNLQNYVSTFVTGSCGSGKTTLVKKALLNFNNSKKSCACYIDCAVYQTTYSILKEIVPRSEFIFYRSNYELVKELMKHAKERKFVVCLDNFEDVKEYSLVAKFLSMGVCVIVISDSEENFSLLSENVRSNIPSIIRLPSYSNEQTFEILKDRAEKALAKWMYTDAIIKRIADSVKGNIALGINALKVAALNAESRNKKAVEESDIPEIEDCPIKLSVDEKILLKILQEWKSLPASRLYDFYVQSARHPKGERSFRNYTESLCSKGLAKAIGEKRGRVYEIIEVEENAPSKG